MHPIGVNINVNFLVCLILFLAARPKPRELVVMCAAGLCLGAYLGLHGNVIHRTLEGLSYCGAGALPTVWLMPLIRGRSDLKLLGKLLFPPCFGLVSAFFLSVGVHNATYDRFLYAFDGSLGFQPSFWAGQVVSAASWISALTRGLYDALPVLLVVAYLLEERRSARQSRDLFFLIVLIGISGAVCFLFFPAVGAYYIFAKSFPYHPPPLSSLSIVPTAIGAAVPRNCMPSLHTAWAIAILWAARRFSLPWRLTLRGLLIVMLLQTLAYHYLADMIAAVPFILALYALTRTSLRWSDRRRRGAFGFGVLLFAGWLVTLRWGISVFLVSPIIPWSAALLTVSSCCCVWGLLERAAEEQRQDSLMAANRLERAEVSALEYAAAQATAMREGLQEAGHSPTAEN